MCCSLVKGRHKWEALTSHVIPFFGEALNGLNLKAEVSWHSLPLHILDGIFLFFKEK